MPKVLPATPPSLPTDFPLTILSPKFKLGDRVQWHPLPTQDSGIVIGIQYLPVPQHQTWAWKYTIWLDTSSSSRSWVNVDTAWEIDLDKISKPTSH